MRRSKESARIKGRKEGQAGQRKPKRDSLRDTDTDSLANRTRRESSGWRAGWRLVLLPYSTLLFFSHRSVFASPCV